MSAKVVGCVSVISKNMEDLLSGIATKLKWREIAAKEVLLLDNVGKSLLSHDINSFRAEQLEGLRGCDGSDTNIGKSEALHGVNGSWIDI